MQHSRSKVDVDRMHVFRRSRARNMLLRNMDALLSRMIRIGNNSNAYVFYEFANRHERMMTSGIINK